MAELVGCFQIMAAPLRTKNGVISLEGDIAPLHRLFRRLAADTTRTPQWRAEQMAHVSALISALNDDLAAQAAARDELAKSKRAPGSKPEQADDSAR